MTEAPERQITLSECSICYEELKHRGGCAIVLCGSCEHAFCMNCVLEKPNGTECPCCRQPMTTGNWPNETEGEIRRRVAQASKEFDREKQILRDQAATLESKIQAQKTKLSIAAKVCKQAKSNAEYWKGKCEQISQPAPPSHSSLPPHMRAQQQIQANKDFQKKVEEEANSFIKEEVARVLAE